MNYNQKKVTKFVVITKQRSGSSWLIDLLNSNEDIRAFGEIFLDRPVEVQPWNQNTLPPIRFYEFKKFNSNFRPWITWQYLNMNYAETDHYSHTFSRYRGWEILRQMTFRLRVPRPSHTESNPLEQEAWKKN